MRITMFAVGTRMPRWVDEGVDVYRRRLPPQIKLDIDEVPLGNRSARGDVSVAQRKEADQLLKRAGSADRIVALDERGAEWTSVELGRRMNEWQSDATNVALLIGGPDGLTEDCRQRADDVWALSRLTLPHGLVRVVLAEQIYRAWTIIQGHPYHRE
ncbi:MAG: 23S rRNA (pseudouridine(1915)-N(3))-methyltransferase RlmH [Gammaproteobacteria bacterium]